jgi:tetratricopeptide (TPR) repeat protein
MASTDYYQQGVMLTQQKDYDGAIEVFNKRLEEYPDDFSILDCRASAYEFKGETENAIADYTRMIALKPENPSGWNRRGNLYDELGEYDKAIADYTQCIPLSMPNYGTHWSNRGISYYHTGDLDAALADLNKSIECWGVPESSAWALMHRGLVLRGKGDLDKALEDFTLAAIYRPEDDFSFYQGGYIWFMRQDYDQAIEWFSKAIALKDNEADYYLARGVCYWNQCLQKEIGFWHEDGTIIDLAEEDFTKAIEYAPDMADAYFNRGTVRCDKARESNNLIKAIFAEKVTDEVQRAVLLARLDHIGGKDFIPMLDALFRGLRSGRDQVDGIMAQATALFVKYDAGEAIEDLSRAIDLGYDDAEAYYHRGRAYALIGAKKKALGDYKKTCALDPNHRKAAEKRDELLESL